MHSKYWSQRFDQIEQSANNKSTKYIRSLEKKYTAAASEIDTKINAWYRRIAKNNNVSMTEAKRLLSASELDEFKWTVQQYIEYGQANAVDKLWMKELENASAKFHISRLEAMKLECRQQIEVALANGQQSMFDTLADVYKDSFYHSCFEIQKGVGVGFDVSRLDDKQVRTLLQRPWSVDGTNFSEKLWGNKKKLINTLDQELSRMVLTGESPDKAIKNIRSAMGTSLSSAKRLVLTEQAYFTSMAQKDAYTEFDVEEFEFVGTLDGKTCDDCGELDGQHFPMKDMMPGVNAAPMHPFCRCTTAPYFDDEFTIGKRIAKDKDGEYYEVPEKMTFSEWKEQHVVDAMSDKTREEYARYKKVLGEKTPTVEKFSEIRYNKEKWKAFKTYTSAVKSGELTPLADFELYQDISKQVDKDIVGQVTSNGIAITGKSDHSIARIIGSVEQRRNGVEVSDVLDALTNKDSEVLPVKTMKNGKSQKFRNKKVEVSINPETGNIIQVNPVHTRKKVKS